MLAASCVLVFRRAAARWPPALQVAAPGPTFSALPNHQSTVEMLPHAVVVLWPLTLGGGRPRLSD
eukprot:13121276-Alexandrium_andersonii.AAC.1